MSPIASRLLMLALATAWCGASLAEDDKRAETISGLARTVGVQAGIRANCRKNYTIDEAISDRLENTARQVLDKALGRQQAQTVIEDEDRRVAEQIAAAGAQQWCSDQRDLLNADGVRVFVD